MSKPAHRIRPLSPAEIEQFLGTLDVTVGHSAVAIVGIKSDGNIAYQLVDGSLSGPQYVLLSRFTRRWSAVQQATRDGDLAKQRLRFATALFHALNAGDDALAVFDEFAGHADSTVAVEVLRAYGLGGLMTALLLTLVFLMMVGESLAPIASAVTMGAVPGLLGAAVSILLKVNTLAPSEQIPIWFARLQGGSRVALGTLFGVIAHLAIEGGVVGGGASDNLALAFLIAVAAGFSERWAPDILGGISDRAQLRKPSEQSVGGGGAAHNGATTDSTGGEGRDDDPAEKRAPTAAELLRLIPEDPEESVSGADLLALLPEKKPDI